MVYPIKVYTKSAESDWSVKSLADFKKDDKGSHFRVHYHGFEKADPEWNKASNMGEDLKCKFYIQNTIGYLSGFGAASGIIPDIEEGIDYFKRRGIQPSEEFPCYEKNNALDEVGKFRANGKQTRAQRRRANRKKLAEQCIVFFSIDTKYV